MKQLKITKLVGTSYLCSEFTNLDGTVVTDHPVILFETTDKNIYACVMFTSSCNAYTTQHPDGAPIGFYGCSTHKNEKVSLRVLQSEIYLVPKDEILVSEYSFKYIRWNKHSLDTIKFCIEYGLKTNYQNGIKSVHYYNQTKNVENMEEIMLSMHYYISKVLNDDNFYYPKKGLVNTKFNKKNKKDNEEKKKVFNGFIFKKRYNS